MERLTRLVDGEMEAATLEHNEISELEELAYHIRRQLDRVLNRQSVLIERRNEAWDDNPTYPEDDHALTTLPPTSDDDDEQDAEEDDSDHGEYDPWAFAEGH